METNNINESMIGALLVLMVAARFTIESNDDARAFAAVSYAGQIDLPKGEKVELVGFVKTDNPDLGKPRMTFTRVRVRALVSGRFVVGQMIVNDLKLAT